MKNARQNALRWIRDAADTLRQAERTYQQQDAHNWVCFLAEQVTQKSLKAVLFLDGARFIRIHSVAELIKEVSQKRPDFLPLRAQAGILDQYYLTTRYPDAVAEPAIPSEIFTQQQAEDALRTARSIFEMSKSVIS